jgi:hypothetical protein
MLGRDVESSAERQIFDRIRQDPATKDWVVIHSLGLSETVAGKYGEIDFVVLVPNEGIFCLEVKGGDVKRENGRWVFINRLGQRTIKDKSPFLQAREGMFTLIKELEKKYSSNHPLTRLMFRYGVLFPHIDFTDYGTEAKTWEVYDKRNRNHPISDWIKRLAKNIHESVRNTNWFRQEEWRPTKEQINEVADFLRGDFELIRPLADKIEETEKGLLQLTLEQYSTLDSLEDNERCLFEGGAGTGKTVLAVEFARREAAKNRRVAFFTYNKFLAQYAANALWGVEGVTVVNFHKWMRDIIVSSNLRDEFLHLEKEDASGLFSNDTYPLFASDALTGSFDFQPFDTLVVDEAQDLLSGGNVQVFDDLLRGGLNGGRWAIFGDFHQQAIYSDIPKETMIGLIRERAPYFTSCRLTRNCRNTKRIGEETAEVSGFEVPPFIPASVIGEPVDYSFYKNENDQAQRIELKIRELLTGGLKPKDITILTPKSLDKSCLGILQSKTSLKIKALSSEDLTDTDREHVTLSTIQSYKGLENKAIIITDIEKLDESDIKSIFYVGMSRARSHLVLVLPESVRNEYNAIKLESIRGTLN